MTTNQAVGPFFVSVDACGDPVVLVLNLRMKRRSLAMSQTTIPKRTSVEFLQVPKLKIMGFKELHWMIGLGWTWIQSQKENEKNSLDSKVKNIIGF